MATKTLTITEEAYDRLNALREPNESFSKVIIRVAGGSSLLELAGVLTGAEADKLESDLKKIRIDIDKRVKNTAGALAAV